MRDRSIRKARPQTPITMTPKAEKPEIKKTETEKDRDLRVKYADMGRKAGHLTKRESDEFGNERKVQEWENEYHEDKTSNSGRAREKERRKAAAQVQSKIDRMATERGTLDTKDYQDFDNELSEGIIEDKRGKSTGKASFYISNNPLAK